MYQEFNLCCCGICRENIYDYPTKAKEKFILVLFYALTVTTEYVSFHPVWTTGRAAGQPFVIKGTVYYPEETIMYLLVKLLSVSRLC